MFLQWLRREGEELVWAACEDMLCTEPPPEVVQAVADLLRRASAR